jgi:hypothetical protein
VEKEVYSKLVRSVSFGFAGYANHIKINDDQITLMIQEEKEEYIRENDEEEESEEQINAIH